MSTQPQSTTAEVSRDPSDLDTYSGDCPGCGTFVASMGEVLLQTNPDGVTAKCCPECWHPLERF